MCKQNSPLGQFCSVGPPPPPAPLHTHTHLPQSSLHPSLFFSDNEGESPRSPSEPGKGHRSPAEQKNKGLRGPAASPLGEPLGESPDPPSGETESSGEQLLEEESPGSQLFEREIEALPEDATPSPEEKDISLSRKQSEDSLPPILENGADVVTSTSFNGRVVSSHTWQDSSPPCKRSRKEKQLGSGPLEDR